MTAILTRQNFRGTAGVAVGLSAVVKPFSSYVQNQIDTPYQTTVNVGAKPRDLRPIVQAIMEAENWILERMPADQKLAVLLGEAHPFTTHIAVQQAVIAAHLQAKKHPAGQKAGRDFAYGREAPHDRMPAAIRHDSPKLIEDFLSKYNGIMAEPQKKRLFRFCLTHGVKLQFNDVSSYQGPGGFILNQEDAFTRDLVKKHVPILAFFGKKIYRASNWHDLSLGLRLSNLAMVEKAAEHMRRSGAQIYLQNCGLSHALGYTGYNHPYEDSLAAAFKKAGFAVLTVFPSSELLFDGVPAAASEDEHIIKIANIGQTTDKSQKTWDDIDEESGGILKDPSKIVLPALKAA